MYIIHKVWKKKVEWKNIKGGENKVDEPEQLWKEYNNK